jgi:large conductance mechanosensitive channel
MKSPVSIPLLADEIQITQDKITKKAKFLWSDFTDFITQGSMMDLAVGLVIGSAFTTCVNSFVKDILSPILGLGAQKNLEHIYAILKCPANVTDCQVSSWATAELANKDGVVTLNYGSFFDTIINFFIIAIFLYTFVRLYTAAFKKFIAKLKKCPFCTSMIPIQAIKCMHCTSMVDEFISN